MFLAWGFAWSCLLWVLYIALEPYVRRRWPATLVSWSRLLAGGFRDPLVGRDILAGCFWPPFTELFEDWRGLFLLARLSSSATDSGPQWQFLGARTIVADVRSDVVQRAFFLAHGSVCPVPFAGLAAQGVDGGGRMGCFAYGFSRRRYPVRSRCHCGRSDLLGLAVFVMIRFGLLALVANFVVHIILQNFPLTTQWSAWYSGISLAGILLIAALVLYGFYTSLGGRPAFGGAVLEE